MKRSLDNLNSIVEMMDQKPKAWKSYRLNDDCVTFIGRTTGQTHETHTIKELAERLNEELAKYC